MVGAQPGEPRGESTRGKQPAARPGTGASIGPKRNPNSGPGVMLGRWLGTQALAGLVLALGLLPLGRVAAYSSILGSLAAWIPAVFFAAIVGRRIGSDSSAFLQSAVIGEALKLLLTGLVCAAVFIWVDPLMAGWFFAGMIAVMVAGWVGLFRAVGIEA